MFIESKTADCIVNLNHIGDVYVVENSVIALLTVFSGKNTVKLGDYSTSALAREAIKFVADRIRRKEEVIKMPDEGDLSTMISRRENIYHHATGKKTKGHGGS